VKLSPVCARGADTERGFRAWPCSRSRSFLARPSARIRDPAFWGFPSPRRSRSRDDVAEPLDKQRGIDLDRQCSPSPGGHAEMWLTPRQSAWATSQVTGSRRRSGCPPIRSATARYESTSRRRQPRKAGDAPTTARVKRRRLQMRDLFVGRPRSSNANLCDHGSVGPPTIARARGAVQPQARPTRRGRLVACRVGGDLPSRGERTTGPGVASARQRSSNRNDHHLGCERCPLPHLHCR
jgi:hypothetical protein